MTNLYSILKSRGITLSTKVCLVKAMVFPVVMYGCERKGLQELLKAAEIVCILKSRDITLPTKVCLVKAMVFPVLMYKCESQTIKKAERQRIDAFQW